MNDIKLSINFITYNRPTELLRAINSLFPIDIENYEIIVWDNNSTPENSAIVKEGLSKIENASYYYSQENLGVGGGRNKAFELSRGEYVFALDDDAVLITKGFKKIIEYLEQNSRVSAITPNIYEPSTGVNYECKYKNKQENDIVQTFTFVGGAHIIRASAVKTKTLYPAGCRFGSEELYASLQMWDNGYTIVKMDEWQVHHLPASGRRLGKQRDKLINVTIHAMKKLTYPLIFTPINYILFRLHLLKNKIKYDGECKMVLKSTYDKKDVKRVKFKTLRLLRKKFGLKPLI